jgi:Vault protein inter-alpha-trypsin domain/von Willebrand factor type A domain
MPTIATPRTIDPLGAFIAGAFTVEARRPIPLVSTRFDVEIDGGLATVVTKRVFRNNEAESIEATITFPVPVHAVLFAMEARIDGRVVKARAQRRTLAREMYEDAIERGKAAVLHEEVLRGVHMLSVAHLGPGAQIEVSSTWVSALSFVGDRGQIRIPLTVGDIYGRSGLPDSDDLLLGGPVQTADVFVRCSYGVVDLLGADLDGGHARVALNAPIDLIVTQAVDKELLGLAADGREVTLRITPHRGGDTALNVAVLIDHSGSMGSACSSQTGSITKHQAIISGLKSIAQRLREADIVDLWEFDTQLAHIGSSHDAAEKVPLKRRGRQRLLALIARLTGPAGGTEIGAALSGTIAASDARDVLLITDGKSHALDVQKLARMGRRITVALVGEDSLEANVGYLAALTGGDIFVAAGADITNVLNTAIGTLRAPFEQPHLIDASLDRVRLVRGNALFEAEWRPPTQPVIDAPQIRAVAAIAASLALPTLDEERAALLAKAEGLVTHLTSLVLVDEAGEAQEGVPANRKIPLPHPSAAAVPVSDMCAGLVNFSRSSPSRRSPEDCELLSDLAFRRIDPIDPTAALSRIGSTIDWDISPNHLLNSDLSALDPQDAWLIERAAALQEVIALAKQMNIDPIVLIVALIARSQSLRNRSAARIAKTIFSDGFTEELRSIAGTLGLG